MERLRSEGLKMPSEKTKPPLIIILGPTAVGKTELSLNLAEKFGGEIISADSRLFYRGMDIGTAKPTKKEQKRVRHHLIDVADPDEIWSLGKFKRRATAILEDIHQRGKVPFLVGGTGQFIRAITEGWVVPELSADERLREALNNWAEEIGAEGLYQRLGVVDPKAAEKILPNNLRRTVRAFEVIFHTGKRFSDLRRREPVLYRILQIGLNRPRQEIDARIDARVDRMINNGFVEEVQRLIDKGYSRELPSMSALGYRQIASYLSAESTLDEAVAEMKRVTRKFFRRQMTWFKPTDDKINWVEVTDNPEDEVEAILKDFLNGE
jgi:tRNA dimethylallyltransferase